MSRGRRSGQKGPIYRQVVREERRRKLICDFLKNHYMFGDIHKCARDLSVKHKMDPSEVEEIIRKVHDVVQECP